MKPLSSIIQELESTDDSTIKAAIIADFAIRNMPEDIARVFRACTIFHWFDQDIIRAILPEKSSLIHEDIFSKIEKFSFIEKLPWGLAYQGVTRQGLLSKYKEEFKQELSDAAALAAIAYLDKRDEKSKIEAIYCFRISGHIDEANKLWKELEANINAKEDWQLLNDIMELQEDAKLVTSVRSLYSINNTETNSSWYLAHPYPMSSNFTGRLFERKMLTEWLNDDIIHNMLILRALGGFGKSALSWYWLMHDVDSGQWPKIIWWSFYEGDASFENFVRGALEYLEVDLPEGQRAQTDQLIKLMGSQKILIIMDGFERALRAYGSMNAVHQDDKGINQETYERQCVNINAEAFLRNFCSQSGTKSKILMTSRLTPRAVEIDNKLSFQCLEVELNAMSKEDAIAFFELQGIKGTRAEMESICEFYGRHPLSLRILAGLIVNDHYSPGDIKLAKGFEITQDIVQNKLHIMKVSFDTLTTGAKELLEVVACFRGSIDYGVLKFFFGISSEEDESQKAYLTENLNNNLDALKKRALIFWSEETNKYDLHPVVRHYVYENLAESERFNIHKKLVSYFFSAKFALLSFKPQTIDQLTPTIEEYYHNVQIGKLNTAVNLYRTYLQIPLYYQFGAYETCIELLQVLFLDGESKLPKLSKKENQIWVTNELAISYGLNGQPRRAIQLFELLIKTLEKNKDKESLALALGNLAVYQLPVGMLHLVETNLQRAVKISVEINNKYYEATRRIYLSSLLMCLGAWVEADKELDNAMELFRIVPASKDWLSKVWVNRSQLFVFKGEISEAINSAEKALEFSKLDSEQSSPVEKDYIKNNLLLGTLDRLNGNFDIAEQHLYEALVRCRTINNVENEADILLEIARLRYDQSNYQEAQTLAEEALTITQRCGYVLQGANVNLFLVRYTYEQKKDRVKAKEYAEKALKLAYCDGPPYYYKVAYEEAERMLEKLK